MKASFAGITFLGLLLAAPLFAQTKATVSGTFLGDGKDGKIQFLTVQAREPFSDQPAIRLIFTEKDPASSKKPDFDAGFKKLGSALIISVNRDGEIFGCEVAHTAHPKSPFSAIGQIKMQDFTVTETTVSGRVTTGGEDDAFGQKWDVDLTFSAPLPKGAFAAPAATPKPKEEVEEEKAAPSGPKLAVGKLPLPASKTGVEYKETVEQIAVTCSASVGAVAAELAKALKAQGWKEQPGSLVTKNNAILKRARDGAELTIMVQPAGTGSKVIMMTEGLDWSETPESTGKVAPASSSGSEDIEGDANKLINDALKLVPGR